MGWVLNQDADDFVFAKEHSESDEISSRFRVAWYVARMRSGDADSLRWLKDIFNGWSNEFKEHIQTSYLFEAVFAVNSAFNAKAQVDEEDADAKVTAGSARTYLKEMILKNMHGKAQDIFRLNVLRLSQQGGTLDMIGTAFTYSHTPKQLEAVRVQERQYSKEELFNGVVQFLDDADIPNKNPYALANIGGAWYDVVSLTLDLHSRSFDLNAGMGAAHWKRIAKMLSSQHPRSVPRCKCLFPTSSTRSRKGTLQGGGGEFSRHFVNTTIDNLPLIRTVYLRHKKMR